MQSEVINHSVTKDDYSSEVLSFFGYGYTPLFKLLPDLAPYWSRNRDFQLRQTLFAENYWSSAVGITLSKFASQSWSVKSNVALKAKRAREMFMSAGGVGWTKFSRQLARSYLMTDNGAFVEIVRQSSAAGSKILGFVNLDPYHCTRTNNPDFPVIYSDRSGVEHKLAWYQVFSIADMPETNDTWNGVGLCAASRAYDTVKMLQTMQRFVYEKVSGARPLSIHYITGITPKQNKDLLAEADAQRQARGALVYGGAVLVPLMQKEGIGHVEVPIASLPENFNRKQELDSALLLYADALGIDVQDLQPLSGGPLGTSMQSQVLHDKAAGKGLSVLRQESAHLFNDYLLDDRTTFYFNERDYRDELQKTQVETAQIANITGMVGSTAINPVEGRQMLADADLIPREFIQMDLTGTETVNDEEKPYVADETMTNPPQAASTGAASPDATTGQQPGQSLPVGVTMKNAPDIVELLQEILKRLPKNA